MSGDFYLITCEHGGKRIPLRYRPLFAGQETLLSSHRGYDAGALQLAREMAQALHAPLFASTISRLLVDLNRSLSNPAVHSAHSRAAPGAVRQEIQSRFYLPYRTAVEAQIAQAVGRGRRVIHISCHSFTPQLDGQIRNADIGLLYDPARAGERLFCQRWRHALKARAPALKVRLNYPYAGTSDGFTTSLRRRYSGDRYLGLELEINQKHVHAGARHWREVRRLVVDCLSSMDDQVRNRPAQPILELQDRLG